MNKHKTLKYPTKIHPDSVQWITSSVSPSEFARATERLVAAKWITTSQRQKLRKQIREHEEGSNHGKN